MKLTYPSYIEMPLQKQQAVGDVDGNPHAGRRASLQRCRFQFGLIRTNWVPIKMGGVLMLRMSKLADYGTVITTAMARDPDAVHSASSIAAATGIAMPTVSKVLKVLMRGGVVVSLRGANGGYLLPRPPQRITLAQVIAAVDGPIGVTECSTLPGLCIQ